VEEEVSIEQMKAAILKTHPLMVNRLSKMQPRQIAAVYQRMLNAKQL